MTRNSYERNLVLPLDECQPPISTDKTILCCINGECADTYTTSFDCLNAGGTPEEHEKFQINDTLLFVFDLVNYAVFSIPNLIDSLLYKNSTGTFPPGVDQNDINQWLHDCKFKLKNNLLEAELRPAPKGIVVGYSNYEPPGNQIYKFLIRTPLSVLNLNGQRTKLKSVFDWTPVIWNQPGVINESIPNNPTLKHYCEILDNGNYMSYGLSGTNDFDIIINPLDDIRDIYWHEYHIIDTGAGPLAVPNIEVNRNGKKEIVPITGHVGVFNEVYYALLKNGDWQEITVGNNKTCEDMFVCSPSPSASASPSPSPPRSLYFYSTGVPDNYWDTPTNWWNNETHTIQASSIPLPIDSVTILNNCDRGVANPLLTVNNLYVKNEAGITPAIELIVNGTATFLDDSVNNGTIHGNCIFMQNSTHAGIIDGNATFNDASNQLGSVSGVLVCNTSGICGI